MTTLQETARALGDPTRHDIFRYVVDAGRSVTVAELTDHFGLNHNAIRQHLAKLVDAGLVAGRTVKTGGRGRPRWEYEIAPGVDSQWGVVGPYERLSAMLAVMIDTGESSIEVGRRFGHDLATSSETAESTVSDIVNAMSKQGFSPEVRAGKRRVDIVLHNCPFQSVALDHRDVVCAMHRGIAEGLAESGVDVVVDDLVAKDPRRAGCRLRLRLGAV